MVKKYERWINRYRLLPAFLQIRLITPYNLSKIKTEIRNRKEYTAEENEKEINDILINIFVATKDRVRVEKYSTFSLSVEVLQRNEFFKNLDDKGQKYFIENCNIMDAIYSWEEIRNDEVKKEVLPRIIEHISQTSNSPMSDLSIFAYPLMREKNQENLKDFAHQIFELYKNYSQEEYEKENSKRYFFTPTKTSVICQALSNIWEFLTPEEKGEIAPSLIDEMENLDNFYVSNKDLTFFIKDFPEDIQYKNFDRIMNGAKEEAEKYSVDLEKCAKVWGVMSPKVQSRKFDEMKKWAEEQRGGSFATIWKYTDKDIQRQKVYSILTQELYKNSKYTFLDIYAATEGKLQSELLNTYMHESLYASPDTPTIQFREILSKTSKEVYDRNFQYLFGKLKENPNYAYTFLRHAPNDIKNKYSRPIGKYLSSNLETLFNEGHDYLVKDAAEYINAESAEILFVNMLSFDKNHPDFGKDEKNNINIDNILGDFFEKITNENQKKILEDFLDSEENIKYFIKVFNMQNTNDLQYQIDLIQRYLEKKMLPQDKILEKIELYKKIYSRNNSIVSTINLEFLESDLFTKFNDEQILRLTHYKDCQSSILLYKDNKVFIESMQYLMTIPENWTILADNIFSNLQNNYQQYDTLLKNLSDKDLTDIEKQNLVEILSKPNWFGLSTYEDVRDYASPEGKRFTLIKQIFNGNYENLPELLDKKMEDQKN